MSWWAPTLFLPPAVVEEVFGWAAYETWPEGTVLKPPDKLHVTLAYSPDAYGTEQAEDALDTWAPRGWNFEGWTTRVSAFGSGDKDGAWTPVVLELHSFWLSQQVEEMHNDLEARGISVSRFEGGYKPHVTVAMLPPGAKLEWRMPPHLHFSFVPILRELHEHYDALKRR
jgi:2'-5' RNA ligase